MLKNDVLCDSPKVIEHRLVQNRTNFIRKLNEFEVELPGKTLNGASVFPKFDDFLDNPGAETLNSLIQNFKVYTHLVIPKGLNDFKQISHKALGGMKDYFSKFLGAVHDIVKASKEGDIHASKNLQKIKHKDLELFFFNMHATLQCTFYFQFEFDMDIEYLHKTYPSKEKDIIKLKNLFKFYFSNFEEILKYTLDFKYFHYCLRFGYFNDVQVYPLSSSFVNSIWPRPSIESYYHMRLFAVLSDKVSARNPKEEIRTLSSLECGFRTPAIVFNHFKNTKRNMTQYIQTVDDFLQSHNVKLDKSVEQESEELQQMFYFIDQFFFIFWSKISDAHGEFKDYLKGYYNLFQTFLIEANSALSILEKSNSEKALKDFEKFFSKEMHFDILFKKSGLFLVEWGPALDLIPFKEVLKSASENEKKILKEGLSILEGFPNFQKNYILRNYLQLWLYSCDFL
ncbi:hypothetical protein HMI54_012847 [Coelomomyces lativittatus]|nr:hypothetical protein HMI56_000416 [Coelomomyces lativittatus]KAJ1511436.1 hypothetical protein HMI55_006599 [Coelomomyces lativittatus]KAJ1515137.1 hypothetical protein HMI54_012847 [Coelomomyces lativittatus]